MARILLVDNDQIWQELIKGSLPGHIVDSALSYDGALAAIQNGDGYDLAIVDLNLMDQPDRETHDLLGGKILELLRSDYPATRRIALTADTPPAVMKILKQYEVDDLLQKPRMTFDVVREVVQAALEQTSGEFPPGVRGGKTDLRQDFSRWREGRGGWFDQQQQSLRNDLNSPIRGTGRPDAERAALRRRLDELDRQQQEFNRECAEIVAMIAGISSAADMSAAELRVEQLKRRFEADDEPAD